MGVSRILLIHSGYTRIGYTAYQETVFRSHCRTFQDVIAACQKSESMPEAARMRWTCDATGPLQYALANLDSEFADAWTHLAHEGRVEVTAMPFHLSSLTTPSSLAHYLQPVGELRQRGISVRAAMALGVTGIASCLIDLLTGCSVPYLFVQSPGDRAASPMPRSQAAWWELKTGDRLLVWNAADSGDARRIGIGGDTDTAQELVAEYLDRLSQHEYPYDFVALRVPGVGADCNEGVDDSLPAFVRDWNDRAPDTLPRMELALVSTLFEHIEERYGASLETMRGDWCDWAADGLASAAYETAVQRRAHIVADTAERVSAGLSMVEPDTPYPAEDLREAYWNLALFDEHTWGAEESVDFPHSFASRTQWNAKAGFTFRAANIAADALTAACDTLIEYVPATEDAILVCNPLSWERDAYVQVSRRGLDTSLGLVDLSEGVPVPKWITDQGISFVARDIPPMGYKVYRWGTPTSFPDSALRTEGTTLENRYHRIVVDSTTGVVRSWFSKTLSRELLDERSEYGLCQYLYERISDEQGRDALYDSQPTGGNGGGRTRSSTPFVRTSPVAAHVRSGRQSPLAASIVSELAADGCRRVTQEVTLHEHLPWIDVTLTIDKLAVTDPESVYVVFPFFVPGCTARYDSTSGPVRVGHDTLRGSCHDWHTVQGYVDFSSSGFGVTVATPDAPLAQFGRINTGRWQREFVPKSATLFSWAMGNYWNTNFPASQSGVVTLRYRLTCHSGDFDAAAAWRFASEASTDVIARQLSTHAGGILPNDSASLIRVEPSGVALTGFKRAEDGNGYIVSLRETRGCSTVASIELPRIGGANATSPLELDGAPVPVIGDRIILHVEPDANVTLRIT